MAGTKCSYCGEYDGKHHEVCYLLSPIQSACPPNTVIIGDRAYTGKQVWELIAENADLRNTIIGLEKANKLLLAGMESQAELMDGLKQEARQNADLRNLVEAQDKLLAAYRIGNTRIGNAIDTIRELKEKLGIK